MLLLAKQVQLGPYLLWIGVSLALLILASFAVLWYRSKVLGRDAGESQGGLLDELRSMKNRGELTEEEFAAAKHAMVSRISGKPGMSPAPPAPGEKVAPPGFDLTGEPLPKPKTPDV